MLNEGFAVRKIGDEFAALFGSEAQLGGLRGPSFRRRPIVQPAPSAQIPEAPPSYEEFVLLSPDLWMIKAQGAEARPRPWLFVGEDLFKIHFRLKGGSSILFPSQDPVQMRGPTCGVMLHPEGLEKREVAYPGDQNWITIFCKRSVLTDLLDLAPQRLPSAFRPYFAGRSPDFFNRQLPLTPEMAMGVAALFRETEGEAVRRVFTHAKVMDLLCQVVLQLGTAEESRQTVRLTARDEQRLHELRDLLDSRYMAPPSLADLAREAGMNQNKLTVGFRRLFGTSIHEYCLNRRMNAALQMLRTGDWAIGQVAAAVGYDYSANFTAAFKRHFGFTPREALFRN